MLRQFDVLFKTAFWFSACGLVLSGCGAPPATDKTSSKITVEVEAVGRLVCAGRPLSNVKINLIDNHFLGFPETLADATTDDDGHFDITGTGGHISSGPDLFVRISYDQNRTSFSQTSRLHYVDDVFSTRNNDSDVYPDSRGLVDMGTVDLTKQDDDCRVYVALQDEVDDWHEVAGMPFPASGAEALVLRRRNVNSTTPYTYYDHVDLPRDVVKDWGARGTLFHELAHDIWFNLHGSYNHWNYDLGHFRYARHHSLSYHAKDWACDWYCAQTYAFTEGWAEAWETRAGTDTKPWDRSNSVLDHYAPFVKPDSPDEEWEYEGNVRERLRFLANCLGGPTIGYRKLAFVAQINPNQPLSVPPGPFNGPGIHTYPEFEQAVLDQYPDALSCIQSNQVPMCGRGCSKSSDCDPVGAGRCSQCVGAWYGDVQEFTCQAPPPPNKCAAGCQSDSDCDPAGGCSKCVGNWFGDVQEFTCQAPPPPNKCNSGCYSDSDCDPAGGCSKCVGTWFGDVQEFVCQAPP